MLFYRLRVGLSTVNYQLAIFFPAILFILTMQNYSQPSYYITNLCIAMVKLQYILLIHKVQNRFVHGSLN